MANQHKSITINDIEELARSRSLRLLSSVYKNARTKLEFNCVRCGNYFETTYMSLSGTKYGCRKCSKILGVKKGGRAASILRPNSKEDWIKLLEGSKLIYIQEGESEPDNSGRVYKTISYRCENKFEHSQKLHPIMTSRVTNLERNIRSDAQIICKYCESPNFIAEKGNINRIDDMLRLKNSLKLRANSINVNLVDDQIFDKANKKFKFRDKNGKILFIQGYQFLTERSFDPFTRNERLREKFTTTYKDVLDACNLKDFKLLINEDQYNQLVYDASYKYSPSTRAIPFEFLGEKHEAPIGTIKKIGWLPKCNNIKEEICRFIIESMLNKKFPNTKPSSLIGVKGKKLELDGYNSDVFGFRIAFEHQGKQHYSGRYNHRDLPTQKENDAIKEKWCAENDVILIKIPSIAASNSETSTKLKAVPNLILKTLLDNEFPLDRINPGYGINEQELYKYVSYRLKPRIAKLRKRYLKFNLTIKEYSMQGTYFKLTILDNSGNCLDKPRGINTLETKTDSELLVLSKATNKPSCSISLGELNITD